MTLLRITRGLPASGKTTLAREWTTLSPRNRIRVNRDDLRAMMYNGVYLPGVTEPAVITARDHIIQSALRGGRDVICDDTNLPARTVESLRKLAQRTGATFEVIDLTGVPLEECLRRNAARADKEPVPEEWIRDMHAQYVLGTARMV
jgi:tRNA uridine 5-carbamoylmethylation protein Kti12